MSLKSSEIQDAVRDTIDFDAVDDVLFELIKGHLNDQPYKIVCDECGKVLDSDTSVDDDLDITVSVEPCPKCLEDAGDV